MRAVINIHWTRDLHNERIAARHFAALIALVSNFIRDAAQRCAALLSV